MIAGRRRPRHDCADVPSGHMSILVLRAHENGKFNAYLNVSHLDYFLRATSVPRVQVYGRSQSLRLAVHNLEMDDNRSGSPS